MKTIKVAVNKSEQRPDGIEIEVIEPEDQLEQQTLAYLLKGFVRDSAAQGNFKLDLPEQYQIQYQREGSFLLSTGPQGPNVSGSTATYYSPGKPLAVLAIHKLGNRLDVVYGEIKPQEQQPQPQQSASPDAKAPAEAPKADADKAKDDKSADAKADDKAEADDSKKPSDKQAAESKK